MRQESSDSMHSDELKDVSIVVEALLEEEKVELEDIPSLNTPSLVDRITNLTNKTFYSSHRDFSENIVTRVGANKALLEYLESEERRIYLAKAAASGCYEIVPTGLLLILLI